MYSRCPRVIIWCVENEVDIFLSQYDELPNGQAKMIVATTMCLHYFICENHANDKVFKNCDRSPYYVPTILSGYSRHKVTQNVGDTSTSESNDQTMDKF
jgi:hypothetical protein